MLYTNEYKQQLEQMHNTINWGGGVASKVKYIVPNAKELGSVTILDYGCGNGTFKKVCNQDFPDMEVREYDPGIPGKDSDPEQADYIVSVDVLEHIEPAAIHDVLAHIKEKMLKGGFFHICLVEAFAVLPDGRNAHLIVKGATWWKSLIEQYFIVEEKYTTKGHLAIFVKPK